MGSQFETGDILQIAMRIEENGGNFYRFAIQIAQDERAKELFGKLAEAEDNHREIFSKMLSKVSTVAPPEYYPGEYAAYLHNYADNNLIFKKDVMDRELAGIKDTCSAIDFAIRRELDSILYYHEVKGFVSPAEHKAIDDIINEERKHFNVLSKVREQYAR